MSHLFDKWYLVKVGSMRNDYEQFASKFASSRASLKWWEFEVIHSFFQWFTSPPYPNLLDIGCGSGRFFSWYIEYHPHFFASMRWVEPAQAFHPILMSRFDWRNDMSFEISGFEDFAFVPSSISHISALASFHHLESDDVALLALDRIHQTLIDGGIFAMTNWNLTHAQWRDRYQQYFCRDDAILYADIPFEWYHRRYRVHTLESITDLIDMSSWDILLHTDELCWAKNIVTILQKK